MKHLAWLVLAAACGSGGTAAAIDAPGVATGDLYLTVMNVGGRCSVAIGSDPPLTAAQQTLADYLDGQTIPLTASATAGATLGLWHHTTNDMGSGDPGTISVAGQVEQSSTTVTLGDTPGCVWICCASGSDACPTADPCL